MYVFEFTFLRFSRESFIFPYKIHAILTRMNTNLFEDPLSHLLHLSIISIFSYRVITNILFIQFFVEPPNCFLPKISMKNIMIAEISEVTFSSLVIL